MAEGIKVPESFLPKPVLDASTKAAGLLEAIRRFKADTRPLAEHSFAGLLTPDEWERLHRIHAAHHLSFAMPA